MRAVSQNWAEAVVAVGGEQSEGVGQVPSRASHPAGILAETPATSQSLSNRVPSL